MNARHLLAITALITCCSCGSKNRDALTDDYLVAVLTKTKVLSGINKTISKTGKTKAMTIHALRLMASQYTDLSKSIERIPADGIYSEAVGVATSFSTYARAMESLMSKGSDAVDKATPSEFRKPMIAMAMKMTAPTKRLSRSVIAIGKVLHEKYGYKNETLETVIRAFGKQK